MISATCNLYREPDHTYAKGNIRPMDQKTWDANRYNPPDSKFNQGRKAHCRNILLIRSMILM